jgi:hypothetical protein
LTLPNVVSGLCLMWSQQQRECRECNDCGGPAPGKFLEPALHAAPDFFLISAVMLVVMALCYLWPPPWDPPPWNPPPWNPPWEPPPNLTPPWEEEALTAPP